ncbi:MAG: hypothetical protein CMM49_09885 [Rhodospirillaceae bacterium]|nr:hypothetical protein [Rhodospirillaceae bacterium]|tara:strand:+ start:231 stop:521 length:291 start_codon:yes stop_codon:yes gene_type:complete
MNEFILNKHTLQDCSKLIIIYNYLKCFTVLIIFEIIRIAGHVFFGQYNYVIVIAGFLWYLIFVNENLTSWFWIAFLIMIVSLYLGNAGSKQNLENE